LHLFLSHFVIHFNWLIQRAGSHGSGFGITDALSGKIQVEERTQVNFLEKGLGDLLSIQEDMLYELH